MKFSLQNSILFLIILSVLCFNFKTAILHYEYIFHNESFTEKYCINIKKPELKCNGKCHLKKIDTEKETKDPTKKNFFEIEITFFNTICDYKFENFRNLKKIKKRFKKDLFKTIGNFPLEHPPQNLV